MKTTTDSIKVSGLPSYNKSNAIGPTPAASKKKGSITPFKVDANKIFPQAAAKKGSRSEMKPMKYKADNGISPTSSY